MNIVPVFVADGFEEIEALTCIDVLRRGGIDGRLVSVTNERMVTGSHAIKVMSDLLFKEVDFSQAEMLVLAGGQPNANTLSEHTELCEHLQAFAQQGKWVAAICAAPIALGKLGLLEGIKATCYPGFESFLEGALLQPQSVVVDTNFITGNGPGAALEFALTLVSKLRGVEVTEMLRKGMMVK